MSPQFIQLHRDMNWGESRVRRPSRFIFFCGGATGSSGSLRHYLLHDRKIESRLAADVILAEKANQLYRDSDYSDLITFEEDVAQISALVLLIAESAGSLAELGAFASIDAIRSRLAVIMQTEHEEAESFVRFGPVQKIKNSDDRRIAAFPWRLNKNGSIVKGSVRNHVREISAFINEMVNKTPNVELFRANPRLKPFIEILWILHIARAIPTGDLTDCAEQIGGIEQADLRNKLFCMKMCGWVEKYRYSGRDYWFSPFQADPVAKYRFIPGVENDVLRRKSDAATALAAKLKLPKHVREHVAAQKGAHQ